MSLARMICVPVLAGMLLVGTLAAQGVSGVIHGRIVDQSKAAVPGVNVTASDAQTGLVRNTISEDSGLYRFEALPSGTYTVSAEVPGFKRYERQNVELSVGATVRVDIELALGEISESVTVTGGALMVDTKTAEISGLVDDQRVTELPLSGRNVIELAKLLPGVSTVVAPQVQTDARGGPRLTVHGSRPNQTFFTLNGSFFNNPSRNTGLNPPPPDAVKEFRIKTNNYGAAEGRNAGAVVSVVTRRGTNDFHGSVWEFHRNDNLNARSFFEGRKRQRIQNQFGAAAGGPVIKDRVFVFGAYEGFRDRPEAGSTSAFVPTAAERAGDFSNRTKQLVNPFTGQALAGNKLDPAQFDPVARNLLNAIPLPNQPDGRFVVASPDPNDNDLMILRNDIQLNDSQNLFWHFYWNRNDRPSRLTGTIPEWGAFASDVTLYNTAFNHNWTLSPTLISQAIFGFTRTEQSNTPLVKRTFDSLGMNFPDYHLVGSPQFNVSGRIAMRSNNGFTNDSDAWNVSEGLSWIKGAHSVKFGVEYYRLTFFQGWLSPPNFSFNGARSGDPMLDFMFGAFRSVNVSFGQRQNDTIQPWYWNFYIQDNWQIHPRLSVTLGLRYELPSPWNDRRELALSTVTFPFNNSNRTTAPVQNAPPGYLFANYDLPAGLVEADKNNFAPRLGLAWDVFGTGRTSLRLGGGVFYDTGNADTLAQVNQPLSGTSNFNNGRLSAPNAGITDPLPPSAHFSDAREGVFTLPVTGLFTDLGLRTPYFYHWNLGVAQQLTPDLAVSIDYVGKIGRKQQAFYPWNPAVFIPGNDASGNPRSSLDNIDERVLYGPGIYGAYYNLMLGSMFDSWYHGMDVEVNRRLANGFSVLGAYTWSKAIDQNSTFTLGGDSPNPFDLKGSEQGLADFDRRHVLAISALWTPVPLGAFDSPVMNALLAGWQLSPIFRAASGEPLEFFIGDDRALDGVGSGDNQHPIALRNPGQEHSSRASMVARYFDTSAFVLPALGTYGNAGKGLILGPGEAVFDLALLKDFGLGLTEESRIQFRAEFFNMLNRPNFGDPETTMLSSRFGRITSASPGREIQFGLKFLW